jgi:hypothetical protein
MSALPKQRQFVLSRTSGPAAPQAAIKRPLGAVNRFHLEAMTSGVGIWQHAIGAEPDPRFGYCTDDVARALVVDLLHSRQIGWEAVELSAQHSLIFLQEAFDYSVGRFLNFRDADGRWLDIEASEDSHARALVALAWVMVERPGSEMAERARQLFLRALPATASFDGFRPISAVLVACDMVATARVADEAQPAFENLAARLVGRFGDPETQWPWPDPVLTYENALVALGLITSGRRLGNDLLLAKGCLVLDWLVEVQTGDGGVFSPIGNRSWWRRGHERSRFDQQPIEAASMIAAAAAAFRATGRRRYADAAEMAYGWFLGDNDIGIAIANPLSGGCFDGLTPTGPNQNQGAESTLVWLTALEMMRELRKSIGTGSKPRDHAPVGRATGISG